MLDQQNLLFLIIGSTIGLTLCQWYISTLKQELVDTNAYKLQPSLSKRLDVDGHGCHTALNFGVKAKENLNRVSALYWLPKLHKTPYKPGFIVNLSSCTTT